MRAGAPMSALLAVTDLRKAYAGVHALDGVSFDVERGSVTGLIGPNGSGKSTAIDCVSGFQQLDDGQGGTGGYRHHRPARPSIARAGLTRTFQTVRVYERLSLRDNRAIAAPAVRSTPPGSTISSAPALAPLGMTVFWRTFVYNAEVDNDRLKRPLLEFGPIDDEVQPDGSKGRFADNVFLQTKNGPLDFQSREPLHPMFGRMENTNQAMELQITQEYTGQSRMLTYLGPMWEEILKTDTGGAGLAGEVVDGTSQGQADTALVGVANLGNHENLTGHHFGQANLFAFGRLAWDWKLGSEDIARDWVRMTWSNSPAVVDTIVRMMMGSWEANVSYETPLGVAHQFRSSDHYGRCPTSGSSATTGARSTTTRPTAPVSASTARPPAATSSASTSRRSRSATRASTRRPRTC